MTVPSPRAAVVEADEQLVRTGLIPDAEGRDPPGIEEALGAFEADCRPPDRRRREKSASGSAQTQSGQLDEPISRVTFSRDSSS